MEFEDDIVDSGTRAEDQQPDDTHIHKHTLAILAKDYHSPREKDDDEGQSACSEEDDNQTEAHTESVQ